MLNFDNGNTEFPLPSFAARVWSVRSEKEKKKKIWQPNCGNGIAKNGGQKKRGSEIYGRVKKKKGVMYTIFLQHFHNKSHVISYY